MCVPVVTNPSVQLCWNVTMRSGRCVVKWNTVIILPCTDTSDRLAGCRQFPRSFPRCTTQTFGPQSLSELTRILPRRSFLRGNLLFSLCGFSCNNELMDVIHYQTTEHSAWGSSCAVAKARREARTMISDFILGSLAAGRFDEWLAVARISNRFYNRRVIRAFRKHKHL